MAERLVYVGSAHHKQSPGDYGFHPPVNPRASKSLCDGHNVILRAEAQQLLRTGVLMGMFSPFEGDGSPKYVWCVDIGGEVHEAKIGRVGIQNYGQLPLDLRRFHFAHSTRSTWSRFSVPPCSAGGSRPVFAFANRII